jgi:hypothetical protein
MQSTLAATLEAHPGYKKQGRSMTGPALKYETLRPQFL